MNKPGTQLLSIGEAAAALGVAVATLRRWHRQGRLLPALRTLGGHRRYASEAIRSASGAQRPAAGKTVYARVSSHDQCEQLPAQAVRLERHCHEAGIAPVEVVVLDATAGISREQQPNEHLVEILTVFSSRLYGSRSRKNLKAVAG